MLEMASRATVVLETELSECVRVTKPSISHGSVLSMKLDT